MQVVEVCRKESLFASMVAANDNRRARKERRRRVVLRQKAQLQAGSLRLQMSTLPDDDLSTPDNGPDEQQTRERYSRRDRLRGKEHPKMGKEAPPDQPFEFKPEEKIWAEMRARSRIVGLSDSPLPVAWRSTDPAQCHKPPVTDGSNGRDDLPLLRCQTGKSDSHHQVRNQFGSPALLKVSMPSQTKSRANEGRAHSYSRLQLLLRPHTGLTTEQDDNELRGTYQELGIQRPLLLTRGPVHREKTFFDAQLRQEARLEARAAVRIQRFWRKHSKINQAEFAATPKPAPDQEPPTEEQRRNKAATQIKRWFFPLKAQPGRTAMARMRAAALQMQCFVRGSIARGKAAERRAAAAEEAASTILQSGWRARQARDEAASRRKRRERRELELAEGGKEGSVETEGAEQKSLEERSEQGGRRGGGRSDACWDANQQEKSQGGADGGGREGEGGGGGRERAREDAGTERVQSCAEAEGRTRQRAAATATPGAEAGEEEEEAEAEAGGSAPCEVVVVLVAERGQLQRLCAGAGARSWENGGLEKGVCGRSDDVDAEGPRQSAGVRVGGEDGGGRGCDDATASDEDGGLAAGRGEGTVSMCFVSPAALAAAHARRSHKDAEESEEEEEEEGMSYAEQMAELKQMMRVVDEQIYAVEAEQERHTRHAVLRKEFDEVREREWEKGPTSAETLKMKRERYEEHMASVSRVFGAHVEDITRIQEEIAEIEAVLQAKRAEDDKWKVFDQPSRRQKWKWKGKGSSKVHRGQPDQSEPSFKRLPTAGTVDDFKRLPTVDNAPENLAQSSQLTRLHSI